MLAGDTVPCAGLDELCRGADVYVQTVLRDDLVRMVPMQRFQDTIDYHSTVVQAAQTATRAGVKTLVLTHQVPTPGPGTAEEWTAIARAEFDGEIVFGEDLTTVSRLTRESQPDAGTIVMHASGAVTSQGTAEPRPRSCTVTALPRGHDADRRCALAAEPTQADVMAGPCRRMHEHRRVRPALARRCSASCTASPGLAAGSSAMPPRCDQGRSGAAGFVPAGTP